MCLTRHRTSQATSPLRSHRTRPLTLTIRRYFDWKFSQWGFTSSGRVVLVDVAGARGHTWKIPDRRSKRVVNETAYEHEVMRSIRRFWRKQTQPVGDQQVCHPHSALAQMNHMQPPVLMPAACPVWPCSLFQYCLFVLFARSINPNFVCTIHTQLHPGLRRESKSGHDEGTRQSKACCRRAITITTADPDRESRCACDFCTERSACNA